jgi:diacylglycerol kinase (ATP)
MGKTGTGFTRIRNAFFYSWAGLKAALKDEAAFRQECALAAIMLPASFWLGSNAVEYSLLTGSVIIVLIIELLNSAVEAVVDRIGTDHHTLAGRAKDMGSAAVMLSLLLAGIVWGTLLWERIA